MTLTNCSADTSVVRDLPDEPAITAAELKAAFDGAADNIKTWLNSIHLPELDGELSGKEDSLSLTASSAVFADSDGAAVSKSYAEARQLLAYWASLTAEPVRPTQTALWRHCARQAPSRRY